MKIARPPLFAAIACVIALATALFAAPASAATDDYVALGDSYASGTGAGSYSGGSCYRSANAYPVLWAEANRPASFTFAACSGAKTSDVINNQVAELSTATTLVSVSIGGNDAGFADVMYTCTVGSDSECVRRVDEAKAYAQETLPGLLDNTYAAIAANAPNARVVVMGYPRIFSSTWCWWFSNTKRNAVNSAADLLSDVTAGRASAAGFKYEDTRDDFAGHEVCRSSPWINGIVWENLVESYHPNKAGHVNGYLPALAGAA
ncbi:MAG: lipase [Actinophytocola sp.]|nr:lipase [Actinophytocola sp.]